MLEQVLLLWLLTGLHQIREGDNCRLLMLVWAGALMSAVIDSLGGFKTLCEWVGVDIVSGTYYYLLSLTIASLCLTRAYFQKKKLYNPLLVLIVAQIVFWLYMFMDYRFWMYSYIDSIHYQVSLGLYIAQLAAAFNGDTDFFNRLFGRCISGFNKLCRCILRGEAQQ